MPEEKRWNIIAADWWRALQPAGGYAGNRAALARLRRCTSPVQAAVVPEAVELAQRVGVLSGRQNRLEDILLTAIVLAHVREDNRGAAVPRRLGGAGADRRAVMSPLRFARLLTAQTAEEKLIAFRRAVALLGGAAHVPNLAEALLDWSEKTRIAWAFDYHAVPAPDARETQETTAQPAAGDAA